VYDIRSGVNRCSPNQWCLWARKGHAILARKHRLCLVTFGLSHVCALIVIFKRSIFPSSLCDLFSSVVPEIPKIRPLYRVPGLLVHIYVQKTFPDALFSTYACLSNSEHKYVFCWGKKWNQWEKDVEIHADGDEGNKKKKKRWNEWKRMLWKGKNASSIMLQKDWEISSSTKILSWWPDSHGDLVRTKPVSASSIDISANVGGFGRIAMEGGGELEFVIEIFDSGKYCKS
jgi:hypothetical protein